MGFLAGERVASNQYRVPVSTEETLRNGRIGTNKKALKERTKKFHFYGVLDAIYECEKRARKSQPSLIERIVLPATLKALYRF